MVVSNRFVTIIIAFDGTCEVISNGLQVDICCTLLCSSYRSVWSFFYF